MTNDERSILTRKMQLYSHLIVNEGHKQSNKAKPSAVQCFLFPNTPCFYILLLAPGRIKPRAKTQDLKEWSKDILRIQEIRDHRS